MTREDDAIVTLAEHCLQKSYAELPAEVSLATKRQILDLVGVGLAGGGEPGARQLRDFTIEMGGRPEALIWGTNVRAPAHDAARANATMAHALDYDDDHEDAFIHPSVITVPAAIAVAELVGGVSGRELITAVTLGTDLACRLARSARPGVPAFEQGWHNTSLYGYFASAFVAGRLLGLSRDQLVAALGIALHQAAGNSQAHVDGALTKRMGAGFASYAGVMAARLAQRGVTGATGVLEGLRGFYFQYHGGDYSRQILLEGLGESYASTAVSVKPWPSCRGSHPAVDAALRLAAQNDIEDADIAAVTVFCGPAEYSLLASPVAEKRHPVSTVDAQFSIPWVAAAALVDHRVGLEHFTPEALARAGLGAFTERISTAEDPDLARPGGGTGAARVEVRLHGGTTVATTVRLAKGEPSNPVSEGELEQKFVDCAARAGMGGGQALELRRVIGCLDALPHTGELTRLLALDRSVD